MDCKIQIDTVAFMVSGSANDEFFPRIFKSRKVGNDICFIMTFFRISVRKTSGENSHCNEENTVKIIQIMICCNTSGLVAVGPLPPMCEPPDPEGPVVMLGPPPRPSCDPAAPA